MLLPGTLPSRRDLQALTGEQSGASGEGAGDVAAGPISRLEAVEKNLARLDEYLCSGLRVRDVAERDALLADAMLLYVKDAVADEQTLDEVDLFRALRRGACAFGLAEAEAVLPMAGSATLRNSVRAATRDVREAITRYAPRMDEDSAIDTAVAVCIALALAPVWFIEEELPQRLMRAYAICAAATAAAHPLAPKPLTATDLEAREDDLAKAYARVWRMFPPTTIEARVLWELGLSVDEIARVVDASPPAVDTALLQVLTVTKAFNILVGRESASQLEHGRANRAYERMMRDIK